MKIISAAILIASVPLTPVLAEEVLHCADTNNAGFKWDKKGAAWSVTFPLHRFTIKVGPTQSYPFISDNERLITRTTEGMSVVCRSCTGAPTGGKELFACFRSPPLVRGYLLATAATSARF